MGDNDVNYLRTLMLMHCGWLPYAFQHWYWYVRKEDGPANEIHEVEQFHADNNGRAAYFWNSEEEALVAYCKFYKLGPYTTHGGNNEHEQRSEQQTTA